MQELEQTYQARLKETEARFKHETKILNKKWTLAEQAIRDKLKILKPKTAQKSLQQSQTSVTQQSDTATKQLE